MSKYKNKKVIYKGIKFDSIRECTYYKQLCMLKRATKINDRVVKIELQPEFELQPAYFRRSAFGVDGVVKINKKQVRAIKYRADFRVTYANGWIEIVDVKGVKTDVYKLKKKIFEYVYPDLEIVEV